MKFPVDASQRDVLKAFGKLGFVFVRKENHPELSQELIVTNSLKRFTMNKQAMLKENR